MRDAGLSGPAKALPDTLITKISLGKAGRGQVEAMKCKHLLLAVKGYASKGPWVRGHYMKSRSGKLVWRMPHLRGAGPLVPQLQYVTSPVLAGSLTTTPQGNDTE